MFLFVIGGLTGIILANPTIDFQVHNTLFLIAHIHNVIIPGVLFGMLAGYHYWFPKAFGFRLNETWGKIAAWLWSIGFMVTFFPLYYLGLLGMPRRSATYTDTSFQPWMIVSAIGALIIGAALFAVFAQLVISIRQRKQNLSPLGDPWDGRTLEWAISSPPPIYNFAILPQVQQRDEFAEAKMANRAYPSPSVYEDIHMPKDTSIGLWLCLLSIAWMFGLVWWMWWLVVACTAGMFIAFIAWSFRIENEYVIPAETVREEHEKWLELIRKTQPVDRDEETTELNLGYAKTELEG